MNDQSVIDTADTIQAWLGKGNFPEETHTSDMLGMLTVLYALIEVSPVSLRLIIHSFESIH